MGLPGRGGVAALVYEQFSAVQKLSGSAAKSARGGGLTVGIHHSRNDILHTHNFVDMISRLLLNFVNNDSATRASRAPRARSRTATMYTGADQMPPVIARTDFSLTSSTVRPRQPVPWACFSSRAQPWALRAPCSQGRPRIRSW